jgi:hypothetical protein
MNTHARDRFSHLPIVDIDREERSFSALPGVPCPANTHRPSLLRYVRDTDDRVWLLVYTYINSKKRPGWRVYHKTRSVDLDLKKIITWEREGRAWGVPVVVMVAQF